MHNLLTLGLVPFFHEFDSAKLVKIFLYSFLLPEIK